MTGASVAERDVEANEMHNLMHEPPNNQSIKFVLILFYFHLHYSKVSKLTSQIPVWKTVKEMYLIYLRRWRKFVNPLKIS